MKHDVENRELVCILIGGLGNQLFQVAHAYNLAKKYNANLVFDMGEYLFQTKNRKPDIYRLKISEKLLFKSFDSRLYSWWTHEYINEFAWKLFKKEVFKEESFRSKKYHWITGESSDFLEENMFNVILGYFQREKFFISSQTELRPLLAPKDSLIDSETRSYKQKMQSEQSVSIHVRRGDFVDLGAGLSMKYYNESITLMKELLSNNSNDLKFYVFSNDIDWCKKKFVDTNIEFVSIQGKNADINEMYLMSCCKHNITSNSTYGWWGAWLNSNPKKIVIAPSTGISQQIIPQSWIRI